MTPLVAVVAFLLTYRLTLLVTADVITKPYRDRLIDRYVHPLHERTSDVIDLLDVSVVLPVAIPVTVHSRYYVACRCGVAFEGDTWSDVASEMNGHTNPHQGEMTTGPRWLPLVDCPWCLSFWIAVPVAWSAWCFGDRAWWFVPALAFAGSAVTGILATVAKPES